jgi:hypothetical protein
MIDRTHDLPLARVRRDLAAWLSKWSSKYARLCA